MKSGIAMLMLVIAAVSAAAETVPAPTRTNAKAAISSDAFAAARFAARDRQVRIVRVQSAETEAAAANFKLCLHVRSEAKRFRAAAVILRSASGHFSLSQWNPGGC
jgi:hypothetical protein